MQVCFIDYVIRTFPLTLGADLTILLAVALTTAAQQLGEVTVTGKLSLVEATPNLLIYHAEKDLTTVSGMAADVLRNEQAQERGEATEFVRFPVRFPVW